MIGFFVFKIHTIENGKVDTFLGHARNLKYWSTIPVGMFLFILDIYFIV